MAYNTKEILRDVDGNPISQYYNPQTDSYEPVEGSHGGNKVVVYKEDGTESNLSLDPIISKLEQLTGTIIDEETRKTNEVERQGNETDRGVAEGLRDSAEGLRDSKETIRQSNEGIRETNEVIRIGNNSIVEGWIANPSQFNGKSIEYNWKGTELGIRLEGDAVYEYVNLKGETGSIDSLDASHIQSALGFIPKNYIAGENVTITDNVIKARGGDVDSVNGKTGDVVLNKSDVGLANVTNVEQASKVEFESHLADLASQEVGKGASLIGLNDSASNFESTNVEGAINELFTNVSDGKSLVGGAITGVDDSVVIPADPTFNDLASAIGSISTGKKWAIGSTVTNSSNYDARVRGLTFSPSIVIVYGGGGLHAIYIKDNSYGLPESTRFKGWGFLLNSHDKSWYTGTGAKYEFFDDGFHARIGEYGSMTVDWLAIE